MSTSFDKAYLIGGHGSEGRGTFIVPPGCIIVVKAKTGYATAMYDRDKGFLTLSPEILNDPIANYPLLHNTFGSLAIYMPGDRCPNYSYTLVSYTKDVHKKMTGLYSFGSGLIDMDRMIADKNYLHTRNQWKNLSNYEALSKQMHSNSSKAYFEKMYQYSVYPTSSEVRNIITTLDGHGITAADDIINTLTKEYHITQQELCSMFKGVYYNFACRVTSVSNKLRISNVSYLSNTLPNVFRNMRPLNKQNMSRKKAILDAYHGTMPLSRYRDPHKSAQILHTQSTNMLKQHIGEAEKHRKPYIRSLYTAKHNNTQSNRNKQNGSSRRNQTRKHQ